MTAILDAFYAIIDSFVAFWENLYEELKTLFGLMDDVVDEYGPEVDGEV